MSIELHKEITYGKFELYLILAKNDFNTLYLFLIYFTESDTLQRIIVSRHSPLMLIFHFGIIKFLNKKLHGISMFLCFL